MEDCSTVYRLVEEATAHDHLVPHDQPHYTQTEHNFMEGKLA